MVVLAVVRTYLISIDTYFGRLVRNNNSRASCEQRPGRGCSCIVRKEYIERKKRCAYTRCFQRTLGTPRPPIPVFVMISFEQTPPASNGDIGHMSTELKDSEEMKRLNDQRGYLWISVQRVLSRLT
jgi:hypothetical protein